MMHSEQYAFIVEWNDPVSSDVRKFKLLFFTTDDTLELWDIRNHRLFLKRIRCENVSLSDIYIGATLLIFSRTMRVIEYADLITQSLMNVFAQRVVGILKPNAVANKSNILKIISDNNFKIVNLVMANITRNQAALIYEDCEDEELLSSSVFNMTAGPSIIFELLGENAISRFCELVGPTDPAEAKVHAPESIRAKYGVDKVDNAIYFPTSAEINNKVSELFFARSKGKLNELNLSVNCENSTCCIVKPHVIKEGKLCDIIGMIELELGFKITAMRMCSLSITQAEEFYEIYKTVTPCYQSMVEDLSSGSCVAMGITGNSNISNTFIDFKRVVGSRSPHVARLLKPNTIRAIFGKNQIQNAVHVTDLEEDILLELQFFFVAM